MYTYSVKIDWITFVVPVVSVGEGSSIAYLSEFIEATLSKEFGYARAFSMFADLTPLGFGRAPYKMGFQSRSKGITLWCGGEVPHMSVEFSGVGCDYLRSIDLLEALMALHSERVSRLDVAVDLECDLRPLDMVKARQSKRQKTTEHINSPTGETYYVGSRHSERYCRVYRYSDPHPRSNLLRLEMVSRRANARTATAAIAQTGLESVAKSLLQAFGWEDFATNYFNVKSATISAFRPERGSGSTLRWFITQVAPAFKRLVRDGTIKNAEQFIQQYLLADLYEDGTVPFDKLD